MIHDVPPQLGGDSHFVAHLHADALGQPEELQLEVHAQLLDIAPNAGQLEEEGAAGACDASPELGQPGDVLTR